MVKHHFVVVEKADGGVEYRPMKQWLRDNHKSIPGGVDPVHRTSHELRRILRKLGWRVEELADRVLLYGSTHKYDASFSDETDPDISEDEIVIEAEEITFGLERDLQSALRTNIDQLETGLKIIDDGKERITEAGRIDITALDTKGSIVVIELKAGTAGPDVVAQVLAYMGTIAEASNQPVRGILVAGDFHTRVVLASRAISNLELKKYSFQFKFDIAK